MTDRWIKYRRPIQAALSEHAIRLVDRLSTSPGEGQLVLQAALCRARSLKPEMMTRRTQTLNNRQSS